MSDSDSVTVAILTISDSAMAGTRADASGPALVESCRNYGWRVVATAAVADEVPAISAQLTRWADEQTASLVLTTGGTGIAARDVTPEATKPILDREIPGIAELIRMRGIEQTRLAVLSRGIAGTRKHSLVINLPGSPKGAVYSLDAIAHLVPHAIELLSGKTAHTASEAGSGN